MGKVSLIALPYDSGKFDERMGHGPLHLIKSGLLEYLCENGHDAKVAPIRLPEGFYTEASALVGLQKLTVAAVRQAIADESRPILLSGNCGAAAISACCAFESTKIGVIWFDAHADFNTPQTSASGFLDGMSLSILTGHCWPTVTKQFDNFVPVPEKNIVLVGARDLDAAEAKLLGESAITHIHPMDLRALEAAVQAMSTHVQKFYLHVDVDVLDQSEGRANAYACSGGMSARELCDALDFICSDIGIAVASITAYDPSCDTGGKVRSFIERIVTALA